MCSSSQNVCCIVIAEPLNNLDTHLRKYTIDMGPLGVYSTVEKVLVVTSSGVLTVTGMVGYSVYISFMRKHPNNRKRLLNVLYAQFAFVDQILGLAVFASVVRKQLGFEEDSIFFEVLLQAHTFLGLTFGSIQFLIACITLIKKFDSNCYLEMSEKWKPRHLLLDLLVLLLVHLLIVGICWLTSKDRTMWHERAIFAYSIIYIVLLLLTFTIQTKLLFVENKKMIQMKMSKLFRPNAVSPDVEASANGNGEDDTEEYEDKVSTNIGFLTLFASVLACLNNASSTAILGRKTVKFYRETVNLIRFAIIPFMWIKNNVSLSEYATSKFHCCKCC